MLFAYSLLVFFIFFLSIALILYVQRQMFIVVIFSLVYVIDAVLLSLY